MKLVKNGIFDECFSSIVYEVIRIISSLFILFIFSRKDFERKKSTKTQVKQFSSS